MAERTFQFGPFSFDPADGSLLHGERRRFLRAKAAAVLHCLVARHGRLVTKRELLDFGWGDRAVTEGVLTTAVRELRRALDDEARAPRYIASVHGRGYRFVAPVEEGRPLPSPAPGRGQAPLVGRREACDELTRWLAEALRGRARVGLVAGEAGIGKTTLVEALLATAAERGVELARGQCIEGFGPGEPYMPLLEAFARLGRSPANAELLEAHAPSWRPHLVPPGDPTEAGSRPLDVRPTPARMLRELSEAAEAIGRVRPLLLLLEDLQWSDAATVAWLDYLSRRPDPAQVLVLGTYRPVEVALARHPLRALASELGRRPRGGQVVLDYLRREDVEELLERRYPGLPVRGELATHLHRRTRGHPLYLVTFLEELARRRVLIRDEEDTWCFAGEAETVAELVPASLAEHVEVQLAGLEPEERLLLETASAAGGRFPTALVAAACRQPEAAVEARCWDWARAGWLLSPAATETWPDGTLSACFAFRHDLLREIVGRRTSPGAKARLHHALGERLEAAYPASSSPPASELAVHFERGGAPLRAAAWLRVAAERSMARSAYSEAVTQARRGASLAREAAGASPQARLRLALDLELLRGKGLMASAGWTSPAAEDAFRRADALCLELADEEHRLLAIWGTLAALLVRGSLAEAQAMAEELLALSRRRKSPVFEIAAEMELGIVAFDRGDLESAETRLEVALALYEEADHPRLLGTIGVDLGVFSRAFRSHLLWLRGEGRRAVAEAEAALERARELDHPFTVALAAAYGAVLAAMDRDAEAAGEWGSRTTAVCTEHGFPYYLEWAELVDGWRPAGTAAGRGALAATATSLRQGRRERLLPFFAVLAGEVLLAEGRPDAAREVVAEGRRAVERNGTRVWEAEVRRLEGELLTAAGRTEDAARVLSEAVTIAAGRGARALELRAATGLVRLGVGDPRAARESLAALVTELRSRHSPAEIASAEEALSGARGGEPSRPVLDRTSRTERRRYESW